MIPSKECVSLVDFLYKPLDVLSGDAYSARKIDDDTTLYLIVDGMGKGLSASLSSMIMTSFVNYTVDEMLKNSNFDFHTLIKISMEYIKPILLDEEALAIDYILLDNHTHKLSYAKFAMPVVLMQDKDNNIIKIKSNNPPLSKYQPNFNLSEISIENIIKLLFYSDGIVECTTKDNLEYGSYVEQDFLDSFTKNDFKDKVFERIAEQEDDLTLIFINRSTCAPNQIASKSFETSLENVDIANDWYTEEWNKITDNQKNVYSAAVVFTELFMNAYEHGNLGINAREKNQLMEDDIYFETLLNKEKECDKEIRVDINKIKYNEFTYITTRITDSGIGFDTHILSNIFRHSETFNGRGVFVSRQSSSGIYYNGTGNSVLFLHKVL